MNKQELVKELIKKAKITNVEADKFLKAFVDSVKATLKGHGKVQLVGFGSFTTITRSARVGVNPQTKKKINIPARRTPKFVAGKGLKALFKK